MVRRVAQILVLVLVVGLALLIVLSNNQEIQISLGSSTTTLQSGVALLAALTFGLFLGVCFGLIYGILSYFRERRLKSQLRDCDKLLSSLIEAREFSACGELGVASELWQKLINRDRTGLIARLELATILERQGDLKEALKVLEAARVHSEKNREALVRVSALYEHLGLGTAAVDALRVLIGTRPSLWAAERGARLALRLGNHSQALEFIRLLEKLQGENSTVHELKAAAELAKITSAKNTLTNEQQFDALKELILRHGAYLPAITQLTKLTATTEQAEAIAKLLSAKAKLSDDSSRIWGCLSDMWLIRKDPTRAVAAARAALRDATPALRAQAFLELLHVLLSLGMDEDAQSTLSEINHLVGLKELVLSSEQSTQLAILSSLLQLKQGDISAARLLLQPAADQLTRPLNWKVEPKSRFVSGPPLPYLSTP